MKAAYPDLFYLGGYAPWSGETDGFRNPDWHRYIRSLVELGFDGVGEMGSKTVTRGRHKPLDSVYYEGLWESCEANSLPIVCHIGDPEEFWHENLIPSWAKEREWGYFKGDYPLDELYTEIETVLAGHPELKITFCHLLFMSPHLERLKDFLRNYENAHIDLTPGVELLYNISRRRDD